MAAHKKPTTGSASNLPADGALPTEAQVRTDDLEREDSEPARQIASDRTSAASADDLRENMIRREAYAIYERKGGEPGHDEEDWLEAEREIDLSKPWRQPQSK